MKKYLYSMLAMATMFLAASCSQDEEFNISRDTVEATFTLDVPVEIGTRAIGDGTSANVVACAVYDANGTELTKLRINDLSISGKKATYKVRLAKGQAYRVAFFAYNNTDNYYDVTDMKNIKIVDGQFSNIEARDAFTAFTVITPEESLEPINRDIYLYRPFAQLNFGSLQEDIDAAEAAGVDVTETQVTVSNVYTAFNAYDDMVAGTTKEVTFVFNTTPSEDLKANSETYDYLAMNYLLVGDRAAEKSLTDVTFQWRTADGKTNNPVTVFSNVPVQRNYRTNIVGYLLTNPAEFNLIIKEAFDEPDYNVAYDENANRN